MLKQFNMHNKQLHKILGDHETINKYPVVNRIISVYVAVVLITFVLFQIAPFVTVIAKTPLYSIQTYLGLIGGVLLCIDLFTNKVLWRGKYCIFLYGICILSIFSAGLTLSYGIKDNIFTICWMIIQISLFYSFSYRLDADIVRKYIKKVFYIVLLIWCVGCIISLLQFVFQIGYEYVVDPISEDGSMARQGFMENRLFGIFNPLNHAAYISLILFILGSYFINVSSLKYEKIILIFSEVILYLHIVLSYSRSALISLFVCLFVVAFLKIRKRVSYNDVRRIIMPILFSCILVVSALLCLTLSKMVLEEIPGVFESPFVNTQEEDVDNDVDDIDVDLKRTDIEDNISNNRISIWLDYLRIHDDIGLVGLSPGNYMMYIRDNFPDLYIVEYIKTYFPEKYDAGIIYHVHNGYLMVYVSTGIIGIVLLLLFMFHAIYHSFRYMIKKIDISNEYIYLYAIVIAGAISAVFDKGLFFITNPTSLIFWLALGYIMMCSSSEKI